MAGRGAPAVTQASTRLQSRSQAQPIKLKLTAEEKPRARRTADQPLYMGNTVLEGETRPRALRPTSDGLATSLAQWNMVPAVTKVTKLEATAPTVFRERPKKPPVRSRPTAAPPANIGRPVATTTVAPVDSVPASTASFLNLKPVGTIDVRSAGKAESSFYVSHFMAEAALEMLKNNAINAEDVQKDQEIWRIDGGI
ncbi:hypothetical protein FKW77_000224 [Venturia effusa]|uniref:Uncharacterized protein n=1 Tax=Venturia effusa TaxID=50376 RepID=A0A517LKR8_9PEZI|nr:hypothetical protein FKW77_000224 [Venturia effusa]